MTDLNEIEIAKSLRLALKKLEDEEKAAQIEKAKRDVQIERVKLALNAYSPVLAEIGEEIQEFIYPTKGTWKDKIISYVKFKNKAVTATQIQKGIEKYEPSYSEEKLRAAIAGELSKIVKAGNISQYKPADTKMKGYYYASPNWLDKEGKLLEEHKPDKLTIEEIWD